MKAIIFTKITHSLDCIKNTYIIIAVVQKILVIFFLLMLAITGNTQVVITRVGNGTAGATTLGVHPTATPTGVIGGFTFDDAGNMYYSSTNENKVFKVDAITGLISLFAGTGTPGYGPDGTLATLANMAQPREVVWDQRGQRLLINCYSNAVIRAVGLDSKINTVAGNPFGTGLYPNNGGLATATAINGPISLCINDDGMVPAAAGFTFIDGFGLIRKVDGNGIITTIAGGGAPPPFGMAAPEGVPAVGAYIQAKAVVWAGGSEYYVVDKNHIRKINYGIINTIAGDPLDAPGIAGDGGNALSATFNQPTGISFSPQSLFISDVGNQRIRKIELNSPPPFINRISSVVGPLISPVSYVDGFPPNQSYITPKGAVYEDSYGNLSFIDEGSIGPNRIRYANFTGGTLPSTYSFRYSQYQNITGTAPQTVYLANNILVTLEPVITTVGKELKGGVIVKEIIDGSLGDYAGHAYLQRHYDIEPELDASVREANVTLYYTQADFTEYNTAVGSTEPHLPANPTDVAGIANIHILQCHGVGTKPGNYTGYTGTGPNIIFVNPTSVTWNSTRNWWEVKFFVSGFSGFYIQSSIGTILPVSLLQFTGKRQQQNVLLNWATATENNSKDFAVQRSADGSNFTTIGKVAAAGNSNSKLNYSYADAAVNANSKGTFYYRLLLTDNYGKTSYSSTVTVKSDLNKHLFSLQSNSISNVAIVNINSESSGKAQLTIFNSQGQRIASQKTNYSAGNNQVTIPANAWASGVYYLHATGAFGKEVLKLIKN